MGYFVVGWRMERKQPPAPHRKQGCIVPFFCEEKGASLVEGVFGIGIAKTKTCKMVLKTNEGANRPVMHCKTIRIRIFGHV